MAAAALESKEIWGDEADELDDEIMKMSSDDIRQRARMIDNDIRIMKSEMQRIRHESESQREKIKENHDKIKLNKQLPYLVGNVVEILDLGCEEDEEEDGSAADIDAQREGKSAVIRTSTRQTIYLPVPGLVETSQLTPGDLVGTNKVRHTPPVSRVSLLADARARQDSYLILEKLPDEYDSRVKAMEVDEKPTEEYSDVGGCDKQIQELIEAVVLPITHKDMFDAIGIKPPKGILLHGPPGTGKTLLARACANQTDAIFLKLSGPQLVQVCGRSLIGARRVTRARSGGSRVLTLTTRGTRAQMFIGDGAKLVRDAFALAKEKTKSGGKGGAIIFIDEVGRAFARRTLARDVSRARAPPTHSLPLSMSI